MFLVVCSLSHHRVIVWWLIQDLVLFWWLMGLFACNVGGVNFITLVVMVMSLSTNLNTDTWFLV